MRIRRRHVVSVLALTAAVAAMVVVWRYTSLVPGQVSRRLSENLLQEHGYRLELDAVRGTPAGEIVFVRPRIATAGDSSRVVLRAARIRVRMRRPWTLLKGRIVFQHIVLERPVLELPLPAAARDDAAGRPGSFPNLEIDAVRVIAGQVARPASQGGTSLLEHLDVDLQVRSTPKQVQVQLREARADVPDDSLRLEAASGSFIWRADTLFATDVRLRTAASQVEADGLLAPRLRYGSVSGRATPVELGELTRAAGWARRRGRLQGPLQVRWRDGQVVVSGTLDGRVDAWTLAPVAFEVESEAGNLVVRRAAGRVNDSPLELWLESRPPALRGRLQLQDVDLRRLVPERAAELPPQRLRGSVEFARRTPRDTLQLDIQLEASEVYGIQVDRLQARAFQLGAETVIERLEAAGPLGGLAGRGRVAGREVDVEFEVSSADAAGLLALAGVRGLHGDLQGRGTLRGPLDDLAIEAEGEFGRLAYGPAALGDGVVALWGRMHGSDPEIEMQIQADSLRIQRTVLQAVSADLAYRDGTLHVHRSQASAGDTLIAVVGSMQSLPHDWTGQSAATTRLRLETALVQLGDQEIRVEDPATLWLRGQALHVDSLQLVSRGGSLRLDGSLDREARLVAARAEAVGFDFAFLRQLVRLRHDVSGTASGWIEAHGSLDRTRLDGRLTAEAGTWNSLPFDSLFVELHSDAQALVVEELRLASPSGALAGRLRCGYLPGLGRWLEAQRGSRSEEEVGAAQLSGTLRFDDLDLAAVWQARAPGQDPPEWSARVSSTVQVSGRVAAPELDLAGEARQVRRGGEGFEVVRFTARYADERLSVQDGEVVDAGQKLLVGGQLPLRLDLRHRPLLLRDAPLVAHVTLPRSSFAIVRRFVNLFEPPPPGFPEGEIEARLDVSGTLNSPQAHGGVQVHAVAFSLRDLEEVYFGVDAQGEFEGKTLRFTALSGRSGDRGTLRGVPCDNGPPGKIVFQNLRSPEFTWCLELDHVPIFSIPEMSGLVNGTLTLTNDDPHGPRPVPRLEAHLTVLEAEITQEFAANPDQGEVLDTDRPEWVGDLSLYAPNGNVWIKNTQADAELEGNVQIVRSMRAGLDVKGQARVKRGNYSLYFERFEITRGDLDFSRHPGFDPELDIEARRGRPGRRIYVTLTGPSTQPRLSFRSDQADLTSDEIQQMLLGFNVSEEPVAAVATVAERTLNDLPWLQYLAVDPANTDSSLSRNLISYNVSAGRAISERIFLIYTQGVKSDINQRVSLEVDINRWLLLESSYERRNISVAGPDQPQNAFDVNLKYRHEY